MTLPLVRTLCDCFRKYRLLLNDGTRKIECTTYGIVKKTVELTQEIAYAPLPMPMPVHGSIV